MTTYVSFLHPGQQLSKTFNKTGRGGGGSSINCEMDRWWVGQRCNIVQYSKTVGSLTNGSGSTYDSGRGGRWQSRVGIFMHNAYSPAVGH